MGVCCCWTFSPPSYSEVYDQAADASHGIEKTLVQWSALERYSNDWLLLGGAFSGKQTLMKMFAKNSRIDTSLMIPEKTRPHIVFASIRAQFQMVHDLVVDYVQHSDSDTKTEQMEEAFVDADSDWFHSLCALLAEDSLLDANESLVQMAAIWKHPSFQRFLDEYIGGVLHIEHVFRPLRHFFEESLPLRILYSPTETDSINSKVLTDGIEFITLLNADDDDDLLFNSKLWHYPASANRFDQRSLWRVLAEEFEHIMFTLDVSVFDCCHAETQWTTVCPNTGGQLKFPKCRLVVSEENALDAQIELFKQCGEHFADATFILMLTKRDIFAAKLSSVPFGTCVAAAKYTGDPHNADECLQYLREYVWEYCSASTEQCRNKHAYYICDLTNNDTFEGLVWYMENIVIRVALIKSGLMTA